MAQNSPYQTRDRVNETADNLKDKANETADNLKSKANEQIDRMAGQVESATRAVREQGREMGEHVQEVADNFKTALDKSIRQQPITTLALTAAVAFVIGALWKS